MKTIVRLYDDVSLARDTVQDLTDAGFDQEKITLMAYDPYGDYAGYVDQTAGGTQDVGQEAAVGAGIGALIGGIGGLLLGMGALTLTGIGPILAAGPIAAALLGAGTGATVGGLIGLLMEGDVDEESAGLYAEGVRRGGTLVIVQTDDQDQKRAERILDERGAVNLKERSAGWRERGWMGYSPQDQAYSPDEVELERNFYTFEPVYREHFERTYAGQGRPYAGYEPAYYYGYDLVARRGYYDREWLDIEPEARSEWERQVTGGWEDVRSAVRHAWEEARQAVHLYEEGEWEDFEDLRDEFYEHYATHYTDRGYPFDRYEIAYRYGYDLATDERYYEQDWDQIKDEARRKWEAQGVGAWADFREAVQHAWEVVSEDLVFEDDFDYFDEDFQSHFQTTYGSSGNRYEHYLPAYRYGYDLATDESFRDRDWDDMEPEIRDNWERQEGGVWDDFKSAVHYAWVEVRNAFDRAEDYASYDHDFRRHYQSNYSTSGYPYERYESAYRYGYDLSTDERYRGRQWSEIETEARGAWDEETEGPWEEFKDAVRHAWSQVTTALSGDREAKTNGNGCCECEDFDMDFRRHYQVTYANSGYPYNRFEYAYHYGCELGNDTRFRGNTWQEVENEARRDWERRGEGPWDDFRDAVRQGWRQVQGVLGLDDGGEYRYGKS